MSKTPRDRSLRIALLGPPGSGKRSFIAAMLLASKQASLFPSHFRQWKIEPVDHAAKVVAKEAEECFVKDGRFSPLGESTLREMRWRIQAERPGYFSRVLLGKFQPRMDLTIIDCPSSSVFSENSSSDERDEIVYSIASADYIIALVNADPTKDDAKKYFRQFPAIMNLVQRRIQGKWFRRICIVLSQADRVLGNRRMASSNHFQPADDPWPYLARRMSEHASRILYESVRTHSSDIAACYSSAFGYLTDSEGGNYDSNDDTIATLVTHRKNVAHLHSWHPYNPFGAFEFLITGESADVWVVDGSKTRRRAFRTLRRSKSNTT